jgi:3D-(3,5/4)-trihydroxycyclohexane-1,2-dione acylhydrolase (decyclizing)
MGYEIAGGLGVKLARPADEVVVMVGDGSYMMANSELSTAVMMGLRLTIVLLDNRGFGCINRLQMATGGENFNNLFEDVHKEAMPEIDFVRHASAMGADAQKVAGISELETALAEARARGGVNVVVIDTDPLVTTEAGGHWWDVAVPEVSERADVRAKRAEYEERIKGQRIG